MIDRGGPRRGRGEKHRGNNGDGFGESQQKHAVHERGCVIMRSAAVVMAGPAVFRVAIGMGMRHAIRMGGNLPVLERMSGVGHGQKGQTSQPKNAESASRGHRDPKLSSGVAWSNPFNAAQRPAPSDPPRTLAPCSWRTGFSRISLFAKQARLFRPAAKRPEVAKSVPET